jgi:hypothetical protein
VLLSGGGAFDRDESSGPNKPLKDLAPGPGADEMVASLARQTDLVAAPGLAPDTPPKLLPLGFSASYWLDLRAYDPVATAAGWPARC